MKKILSLALVLAFASALSAQVQTPKPEWLNKGPLPLTKEKVTYSLLVPTVPEVIDFKTNWFTKFLEEKTNVRINFVMAPNDNNAQREKLNLLIAAGDIPDLIMNMPVDAAMEARFGSDEKIFIPLNKYISDPKIMPNFTGWLAKNPMAKGIMTGVDGNIYGFPNVNVCYHCTLSQKMWINQDWLKKLGIAMPTTTEEFYVMLKAFKSKDPNGNGKADEIPLVGSTDTWHSQVEPFLMSSFILDSGMYNKMKLIVDTKAGKVLSALDQNGYKEGLKYIAKLYKEGLYYNGSITQKSDQEKQLLAMNPTIVGAFPAGYMGVVVDPTAQNKVWRMFTIQVPLKGPNGYSSVPNFQYDGVAANRLVVTKNAKTPEIAARWADLFYSLEYNMLHGYGERGVGWDWPKAGALGLDGKPANNDMLKPYTSEPQNDGWHQMGIEFATPENRFGQVTAPGIDIYTPEGLESMLLQFSKKIEPFVRKDVDILPPVKFTTAESSELQILQVELERYAESQRVGFIAGGVDIDKNWAAYTKKLNDLGLAKFVAIQQKAYDRQYKAK